MARTWLSVTVELLGGRGEELWPWPGRTFAVGPSHTFMDLARAINTAFARWDHSHLCLFTLADGREVTDRETAEESALSPFGPIPETLDIESAKVAKTVGPGAEFRFTYDFGDDWMHRCVVGAEKIDPLETLGISPRAPLPYWGWGTMPDQYGRRWEADDGSDDRLPRRPSRRHPMLDHQWPEEQHQAEPLNIRELRAAIVRRDATAFLAAVTGKDIDDALQHVAAGLPMALGQRHAQAEPVAASVLHRLELRGGPGDQELAEDLLARLRGEPLPGRVVTTDLEMLADSVDGFGELSTGCYLDLETGEVYDTSGLEDGAYDEEVDPEADPDRWLFLERPGSREGWQDMADFAARQSDSGLRDRLEQAIEGKGAFRRFRDLVHTEGLAEQWGTFSDDRRYGRVRELLAAEGVRIG